MTSVALKLEQSFHDNEKTIFGCSHYQRNCYLLAECCKEWFVCRVCHDEKYDEIDIYLQGNIDHNINNIMEIISKLKTLVLNQKMLIME